jgi:hypothetical protein
MERAGSEKSRKNTLLRLEVFLLLSPLNGARSVLTYRARCSVAGQCDPVVWVFSLLEREAQCKLDPAGTREAVRRNELGVDHAEGAGVGHVEGRVEKIGVVEDVEAVE